MSFSRLIERSRFFLGQIAVVPTLRVSPLKKPTSLLFTAHQKAVFGIARNSSSHSAMKTKKFNFIRHFEGEPKLEDFELVEEELPPLKDGDILCEALCFSVDPYMRPYSRERTPGTTMIGSQVAKVIESKHPDYPVGQLVVGYFGWRMHTVRNADRPKSGMMDALFPLPNLGPLPASLGLGAIGMPGNTAYFGFLELCQPKAGEIVVVNGAAGAVGSLVGQIAKIKGCKVIGYAGADDKVDWLKELGFDHAYNYKTTDLHKTLKEAAPNGVDCYFDNVGGKFSSVVLGHMNTYGRISVCGAISQYNDDPKTPTLVPAVQPFMVFKELRMEGFIVSRWMDRWAEGLTQMAKWIAEGKIKYRETETDGFENLPKAFIGMLRGENTGKAIVKNTCDRPHYAKFCYDAEDVNTDSAFQWPVISLVKDVNRVTMVVAKRIIFVRHFDGAPLLSDFKIETETLAPLQNEEILVEALYFSVDPYMRPYSKSREPGTTMIGSQVAKVIDSRHPQYPVGTHVVGYFGWRTHTVVNPNNKAAGFTDGTMFTLPDLKGLPLSLGLGAIGMPGNTAYFGFLEICKPQPGETIVVSGAAGAVGSLVGQIAKIKGCTVIGYAGTDEKVQWLKELGFDHAFNYKTVDLDKSLKEAAPKGVDCYFDNVGGKFSAVVLNHMSYRGRISVCGAISMYNENETNVTLVPGVQPSLVFKELLMEGFLVGRWITRWNEGLIQMRQWIKQGKIQYQETVTPGFENMPAAFIGMLRGDNTGKAIVKV